MKRVLFSLLAVTALSSVAMAADLPSRRAVAPAYIPPVFTWTGFYAGINAGYAFNGDSDLKDVRYGLGGVEVLPEWVGKKSDDGGFTGGAQIGYNYQMGSVVFGIEADFNYADIEKTYYGEGYKWFPTGDSVAAKSQVEWFGTVRPRLGFTPVDRLLVFVTGGLAYGQVKTSAAYDDWGLYGFDGSKTETRVGWTVGAGLEYAITNNLTVKGEYAYVDLGDKRRTVNGVFATEYVTWKDQTNFHIVRAGLNYKF